MRNTKRTKKSDLTWGDPLNWTKENAQPVLHPYGCKCRECIASIKWAQGYMAKVNGR